MCVFLRWKTISKSVEVNIRKKWFEDDCKILESGEISKDWLTTGYFYFDHNYLLCSIPLLDKRTRIREPIFFLICKSCWQMKWKWQNIDIENKYRKKVHNLIFAEKCFWKHNEIKSNRNQISCDLVSQTDQTLCIPGNFAVMPRLFPLSLCFLSLFLAVCV